MNIVHSTMLCTVQGNICMTKWWFSKPFSEVDIMRTVCVVKH